MRMMEGLGGGWIGAGMEWLVESSSSSVASPSVVMPMGGAGGSGGRECQCQYTLVFVGKWAYSGGRLGVLVVRVFVTSSSSSTAAPEGMVEGCTCFCRGGGLGCQGRQAFVLVTHSDLLKVWGREGLTVAVV